MAYNPGGIDRLRSSTQYSLTDLPPETFLHSSPGRLQTPVSAMSADRRGSFRSTDWNYLDTPMTGHASSVSSFYSHEPVTPPNFNTREETASFEAGTSFSEWDAGHHFHGNSLDNQSHSFHVPDATSAAWPAPASSFGYHGPHSLTYRGVTPTSLPVASNDFAIHMGDKNLTSFGDEHNTPPYQAFKPAMPPHLLEPVSLPSSRYNSAFSSPPYAQATPGHIAPRVNLPGPWFGLQQNIHGATQTVVPSHTMMNGQHSVPQFPLPPFSSPLGPATDSVNSHLSAGYDNPASRTTHLNYTLNGMAALPGRPTVTIPKPTKKKIAKRAKQSRAAAKRKPIPDSARDSFRGQDVPVDEMEVAASKQFICTFEFEDGQICDKRFQRVEHLKRHSQTHDGDIWYHCPDPECKKIGEFGRRFKCRNDNLREHMKTHLKTARSKRNTSRTFAEFYLFIRADYPEEEADKYIEKLEAWREHQLNNPGTKMSSRRRKPKSQK